MADPTESKSLVDSLPHSAIWAGLLAALYAAWRLVQFVFWSEDRVTRIATKVLSSVEVQEIVKRVAKQVATEVIQDHKTAMARLEERMDALEDRDSERAAAVGRAFKRIDDHGDQINGIYKLIAERTATPPPERGHG